VRPRITSAVLVLLVLVALSAFLTAAQHHGAAPEGDYHARHLPDWHLKGPDAEARRLAMLQRAEWRLSTDVAQATDGATEAFDDFAARLQDCRFLNDAPSGTTAKFSCVVNGGTVIKVKYGRNPEIHGEVAGTRLLRALGFPADEVAMVPRLRCYGCPRDPFLAVVAGSWTYTRALLGPSGFDNGYTDFTWVSIERRFPAPAIETDDIEGWAWWEVRHATEHRGDLDALRLLAVFLAHWDNKTENQRLVCLDGPPPGNPAPDCTRPLGMIQDLGGTFGPTKVNIATWASLPIWDDRATCRVSMRTLPWRGGTFPDVHISEEGRRLLADRLAALTDDQIRDLFTAARFAEFQTATDDTRDLRQWVEAFKNRVRQITTAGPCPAIADS